MGRNKAILLLFVATLSIVWAAQSPTIEKTTLKDGKRVQTVKKGSLRDDSASADYYESVAALDDQDNAEPLADESYQEPQAYSKDQDGSEGVDDRTMFDTVLSLFKYIIIIIRGDHSRPFLCLTGDIFSAAEMLPIAEKLIAKVEQPGMGKGIVSSARTPYQLADKLFKHFFLLSRKRLVTLTDFDIVGLDALQALALSGEPANLRTYYVETSTLPDTMMYYNGQNVGITASNEPKKSKYWLLNKNKKSNLTKVLHEKAKAEKKDIKKNTRKKRLTVAPQTGPATADEKAKLLHAKKFLRNALKAIQDGRNITHLKQRMNAGIIHQTKKKESKLIELKGNTKVEGKPMGPLKKNLRNKEVKPKDVQTKLTGPLKTTPTDKIIKSVSQADEKTKKPLCTWKYVCTNPNNIDTCHLKTSCDKQFRKHANSDNIDALGISHNPDEHTKYIKQFRKMIGITLVDEEVEKIMESRAISLSPSRGRKDMKRIESLSEYFNNIVMSQIQGSTSSYNGGQHLKLVDKKPRGPDPGSKDTPETESGSSEGTYSEPEEARRGILGRNSVKPTLTVSATTATTPHKVA